MKYLLVLLCLIFVGCVVDESSERGKPFTYEFRKDGNLCFAIARGGDNSRGWFGLAEVDCDKIPSFAIETPPDPPVCVAP